MIVREFQTANGVTVRIDDDCCRGVPEDELQRRRRELRRVLDRIARSAAMAAEDREMET